MPCDTITEQTTPARRAQIKDAIDRLEGALATGSVTVKVGANGAIAFAGWRDNAGLSDLCAYRKLAARNSPALRKAQARAEALAGRTVDSRAVAAGVHSHDGGKTWHPGH